MRRQGFFILAISVVLLAIGPAVAAGATICVDNDATGVNDDNLDVTVCGSFKDGQRLCGSDTIRVINNQVYKETAPNSLTFVLWSDTHYGVVGSKRAALEWIKNKNPDFLFHLGDIADRGELKFGEFNKANAAFDDIIKNTNVENIWITLGGGHDGYPDPLGLPNWNGVSFLRDRKLTSSWYTIKKGNNVFIFCNIIGCYGWTLDWRTGGCHFIPQNYIDWLGGQLSKWNDTENNIWIITHSPLQHTNVYTHEWGGMQTEPWITTTAKIKNLLSKYRVDVLMNGHVHIDPDKSHSSHPNVSGGNVVLGTSRDDLPDKTTFLHVPSVCWRHGREKGGKSTYPAVMYFDLIEGENYFDLKAARVDTSSSVNITYNDGSESLEKIRVPLSYPIEGMNGSNIDFFEQAWGVWEFSNEGDYQWYKDSEGLMAENDSWIISRWDLWENKIIVGFDVNWNEMGSLSHEFYCSKDNMNTWDGPYNKASDLGNCRWVEVKTMIYPSTITYIYDMKLLICDVEAEMQLAPQTLNCKSKNNFVKAHTTLPEGILAEDIDVNKAVVAEPGGTKSKYLKVLGNDKGRVMVEAGFGREDFCGNVPDVNDGMLDITVCGYLKDGQRFCGSDTIRVIKRR